MARWRSWQGREGLRTNASRALRKALSASERVLWQELRGDKAGARVRRQHPLGPYVIDFYVPSARLAIEVDGEQHDPAANRKRDAYLRRQGIQTLRIPSLDLFDDVRRGEWLQVIERTIHERGS